MKLRKTKIRDYLPDSFPMKIFLVYEIIDVSLGNIKDYARVETGRKDRIYKDSIFLDIKVNDK